MLPDERTLVADLKDEQFVLLGMNSDRDMDDFKKQLKDNDVTWPSFFDAGGTGGPIAKQWGVRGWPTIYIIDAKGVIRFTGKFARSNMRANVLELLEEMKQGE